MSTKNIVNQKRSCRNSYLITFFLLMFSTSAEAQLRFSISPSLDYKYPLFINNLEYIRKSSGSNLGLGLGLKLEDNRKYLFVDFVNQREQYRDVVKEEWKAFENIDTIQYKTEFNNVNIGLGLVMLNKRIKVYYESGVILSHWKRTNIVAYAPRNVQQYDTISGKEASLNLGIWLRNGLSVVCDIKRFAVIVNANTNVLVQPYWSVPTYMYSIEPYTRASLGLELRLLYKIYQFK